MIDMRTLEIKAGSIDVRISPDRASVALVFTAPDADMRLFRVMELAEAVALVAHIQRVLGEVET